MKILEVQNLTVKLDGETVLENVNFEVEKGSIAAIIGPNGAGKTTLFQALLGQVPYSGEINWHERPRFGYVPQRPVFDKNFPISVEDLFLLKFKKGFWFGRGQAREQVKRSLREMAIEHVLLKSIGELSAGEMQRVLIAYALSENPNVLLFDEPTANIDVGAEATVYTLIHRLSDERNMSVLLISHDLSVVYQHADSVICLNRNLVCYGVPQHVLTPEKLSELYRSHATFYIHGKHQ